MPTPVTRPSNYSLPFASSGTKNTIPTAATGTGKASFTEGFPAVTMLPLTAGGIPPEGKDFNGILYDITSHTIWVNAGGQYQFDAALSTAIGGYPAGMVLQSNDGMAAYVSAVTNNTTDFNTTPSSIGSLWLPYSGASFSSISLATTGGTTTLTAIQATAKLITVTGTLTSNATLVVPTAAGKWGVINNTTGAYSLTVKTAAGTGVPIFQGGVDTVLCDGTNVRYEDTSAVTRSPGDNTKAQATTEFVTAALAAFITTIPKPVQYLAAPATLAAGITYNVDTSAAAFSLTLPAAPTLGDTITLFDAKNTWGTNNVTLLRNGKNIMGYAQDLIVNVGDIEFTIWYNGTEWRLV